MSNVLEIPWKTVQTCSISALVLSVWLAISHFLLCSALSVGIIIFLPVISFVVSFIPILLSYEFEYYFPKAPAWLLIFILFCLFFLQTVLYDYFTDPQGVPIDGMRYSDEGLPFLTVSQCGFLIFPVWCLSMLVLRLFFRLQNNFVVHSKKKHK